jgi:hypothetical protein
MEHTGLLRDGSDLRDQGLVNERAQVKGADVVDEAELQGLEVQAGEVEGVEDAKLAELEDGLELLELQEGVDVEGLVLEQTLEGEGVEVVLDSQGVEELQVQGVDAVQVVDVQGVELLQVVELGDVQLSALLGGSGGGDSGESTGEDGRELHFEIKSGLGAQLKMLLLVMMAGSGPVDSRRGMLTSSSGKWVSKERGIEQ